MDMQCPYISFFSSFPSFLSLLSFLMSLFLPFFLRPLASARCPAMPFQCIPRNFQSICSPIQGTLRVFPFSLSADLLFETRTATDGAWQCIYSASLWCIGFGMLWQAIARHCLCLSMRYDAFPPMHSQAFLPMDFQASVPTHIMDWRTQRQSIFTEALAVRFQCMHYNAFRGIGSRALWKFHKHSIRSHRCLMLYRKHSIRFHKHSHKIP